MTLLGRRNAAQPLAARQQPEQATKYARASVPLLPPRGSSGDIQDPPARGVPKTSCTQSSFTRRCTNGAHCGGQPIRIRLSLTLSCAQEYDDLHLPAETKALEMDHMKGWISDSPHPPGQDLADALAAAAWVPPNSTTRGIVILNSGERRAELLCSAAATLYEH